MEIKARYTDMSDNDMAEFQREGDITFESETTEEDTSADSPSEDDNQGGETPSTQGENNEPSDTTPFDQHPRWKERETDWDRRFNDQESRHQKDLKDLREEFAGRREDNAKATEIPAWFGGDQKQWDAYRADQDTQLRASETRIIESLEKKRDEGNNAVQEATDYLRSEVAAITADKTLNPSGEAIDAEALLKTVLENELIDSKGRWNYRAGFKIMKQAGSPAAPVRTPQQQARKEAGAATASGPRGEAPKKDYVTSDDFKTNRPW